MRPTRTSLAVLALAVGLTACGAGDAATSGGGVAATTAPTSAPAVSGEPTPTSAAPNASAPTALQFSAPSVGGGDTIDFTQFAGKPVVMWFWAPT